MKRKLLYRSMHRGCKETDILLGDFFKAKINELNDAEIEISDKFLVEDDAEIYDWIVHGKEFPSQYSSLIIQIKKFHNF